MFTPTYTNPCTPQGSAANHSGTQNHATPATPDSPTDAAVHQAYRLTVLETTIAPRLKTDAGRDTLMLRWLGITKDQAANGAIADALTAIEATTNHIKNWGKTHLPELHRNQHQLALTSTHPEPHAPEREWFGHKHWATGATAALIATRHPRARRVATRHINYICQAIARYSSYATGKAVYAANSTIGRHARHLAIANSTPTDRTARHTSRLSDATLTRAVSDICAALYDMGWMTEAARGRHLTTKERVLAAARYGIHQIKAASTRHLRVPAEYRPINHGRTPQSRSAAHRLLSTYPHLVRHTVMDLLSKWLLTRASAAAPARECPSPKKQPQKTRATRPRPTLAAQKTAAQLIERLPWLLRAGIPGRRRHSWAVARILDATDTAGWGAERILSCIEATCFQLGWEIQPADIGQPLAWLTETLSNVAAGITPAAQPGRAQPRYSDTESAAAHGGYDQAWTAMLAHFARHKTAVHSA